MILQNDRLDLKISSKLKLRFQNYISSLKEIDDRMTMTRWIVNIIEKTLKKEGF